MEKDVCGFDINLLKQVKNLLKDSNIQELEIEEGNNLYLRVSKKGSHQQQNAMPGYGVQYQPVMAHQPHPTNGANVPDLQAPKTAVKAAAPVAEKSPYDDETRYYKIKSPVIGTYYEAASPSSPAYVKVGDVVSPDTTVCIVEAMKVMNELKADVRGKIVQLLKSNGSPIQAGEPLFIVEKA